MISRTISALVGAALLAVSYAMPVHAATGKVALTFDDLPGLTLGGDQAYVNDLNDRLLRGLRRHHLPAIGFVIGDKVYGANRDQQIANLEKWRDRGFELGNHTYSHDSPNAVGAKAYVEDIARDEPLLKWLLAPLGEQPRWFRHPYLETGSPEAVKHEIDAWLTAHGYRIAPVTIDADDWEFAEPYDDAITRHDEAARRRIQAEYLRYTERTVTWCQQASQALFGRQIAFVMLLHATRLNADSVDDLSKILKRRKLKAVRLEEAMADPAYRLPDGYAGPDGIDWLERWSDTLHKPLPWDSWQDPPADIQRAYEAVDKDHP